MSENTILEIKAYLGTSSRPVSMEEFSPFWKGLTDAEREEFKKAELAPLTKTT